MIKLNKESLKNCNINGVVKVPKSQSISTN